MRRLDFVYDWAQLARKARYNAPALAVACSVSESQLRRHFNDRCCRPPHDWLTELRLWHAMGMVCSGSPTKVVAVELHFADSAQLCHQFKAFHRCTPSECYRIYQERLAGPLAKYFEKEMLLTPWIVAERALVSQLRRRRFPPENNKIEEPGMISF